MHWFFACITFTLLCVGCQNAQPEKPVVQDTIKKPLSFRSETPNPYAAVDASPMDISYFPAGYPKVKHALNDLPVMRIIYSRPQKRGRVVFGNLIAYDSIWRLGANETTEIEFFKPVKIQNQRIPAGRYTMYCVPEQDSWKLSLNSDLYTWGLGIDPEKDAFHFTVPVTYTKALSEFFTAVFERIDDGANLVFAWDDEVVKLPIRF